jgi:hypothetical protein
VASAAGELAIVSPLRVDAPKGFYAGQPLRFSFTVRNQTTESVAATTISVPVRSSADPAATLDTPCAGGADVTIPAGATFSCVAALDRGYGDPATYTVWADWLSAIDGTWHRGELGPDQTFVLDPPPTTTLATAPQVGFSFVMLGRFLDLPLTITNTGAAVLLIDHGLTVTGAPPGEFGIVSESCTQGPIAPGAACQVVVRFTPLAPGVRGAVLGFTSNAGPGAITLGGTGLPEPPTTVPEQLTVTLSYIVRTTGAKSTKFVRLAVRNIPGGASVRVYCARGCSRRSMLSRGPSAISLKSFVRKPVRVGTRLSVSVTRSGAVGMEKVLTVRSRRKPTTATYCLSPATNQRVSCVR